MSAPPTVDLRLGDCLALLPTLPDGSVDCVISDPPYPEITRAYGRLSEADWMALMHGVVRECRRVLTPTGSALFILQPNSKHVGEMRLWLWEFLVWAGREWNIVQDAYWWNITALPNSQAIQGRLMRASIKYCIWLGPAHCYRDQDAILWQESDGTRARRQADRCFTRKANPSGYTIDKQRIYAAVEQRGGVTPYNLIPLRGIDETASMGHGAETPPALCDWWVRYLCPPGGTVCDPFMGTATVGEAAIHRGCGFVGFEQYPAYFPMAQARIAAAQAHARQLPLAVGA